MSLSSLQAQIISTYNNDNNNNIIIIIYSTLDLHRELTPRVNNTHTLFTQ